MDADLINLTKTLLEQIQELTKKYLENKPPESLKDREFFNKMKLETSKVYELLDDWEKETLDFIKISKSRVHPHQVVSTKENYHLLLMHSYYIDEREKRYMELKYSIQYVFDILIEDIIKMNGKEDRK